MNIHKRLSTKKQVTNEFRNIFYDRLLNDFDNWEFSLHNSHSGGKMTYNYDSRTTLVIDFYSYGDCSEKVIIRYNNNTIKEYYVTNWLNKIIKRNNPLEKMIREVQCYIKNKSIIDVLPVEHQRKLKIMNIKN